MENYLSGRLSAQWPVFSRPSNLRYPHQSWYLLISLPGQTCHYWSENGVRRCGPAVIEEGKKTAENHLEFRLLSWLYPWVISNPWLLIKHLSLCSQRRVLGLCSSCLLVGDKGPIEREGPPLAPPAGGIWQLTGLWVMPYVLRQQFNDLGCFVYWNTILGTLYTIVKTVWLSTYLSF